MIEGGISKPKVEDPATVPNTNCSSYPRDLSSGTVTLATVAQVAADEPLTAANTPEAKIPTCPNPPGIDRIHGARPVNKSFDIRERNKISPIQINNGRAAKDQSVEAPQIFVPSTSNTGALENSTTPTRPVINKAMDTHTPNAKLPINAMTSIDAIKTVLIVHPR